MGILNPRLFPSTTATPTSWRKRSWGCMPEGSPPVTFKTPWGVQFGTSSDVTHFLQMQMNGGRYGDERIAEGLVSAWMHGN
jgi:CubicO group peptidase (beta-lactamase class C family)